MIKRKHLFFVLLYMLFYGWLYAADQSDREPWELIRTPSGQVYFTNPSPTVDVVTEDGEKFTISLAKLKALSPAIEDMLVELGAEGGAKIPISADGFLVLTYVYYATVELGIDFEHDDIAARFFHDDDANKLRQEFVKIGAASASELMRKYSSWRANDEMHSYYETIKNPHKDESKRFEAYQVVYQHLLTITDDKERENFIADARAEDIDERLFQLPSKNFLSDRDSVKEVSPLLAWVLWQRSQMALSPIINIEFAKLMELTKIPTYGKKTELKDRVATIGRAIVLKKKFRSRNFVLKEESLYQLDTAGQKMGAAISMLLNTLYEMGFKPKLVERDRDGYISCAMSFNIVVRKQ